jgi:hypothetical protein
MPRNARFDAPGALQPIIARGIKNEKCYLRMEGFGAFDINFYQTN